MKEDLLASGVFSEHEVTKLIWNEFDSEIEENYRAMRNPEKYKDPDESDKPYHKRSREARMSRSRKRNQLTCIQEVHG